jgi:hypothetical protein
VPDGKSLVFAAREGNGPHRTYIQTIGGLPRLVAHEPGAISSPLSPDGHSFVSERPGRIEWLTSITPTEGRQLPFVPEDDAIEWSADGNSLFIAGYQRARAIISRIDVRSGRRVPVKDITISDPAGFTTFWGVSMTPDARTTVYSIGRVLGDVFIVDGLR